MNNEVKASRIFKKFNYYRLPNKIQKVEGISEKVEKKIKKGKKKKEEKKVLQMAAANDEVADSDTSQEPSIESDYFCDLDIQH